MHVNLGSPNKSNRSLGRTQSLPDAFAQPIWRNAADDLVAAQEEIMQASHLQAERELRPMFATLSTPSSPTPSLGWSSFSGSPMKRDTSSELASIQQEEVEMPMLSDFGDKFEMDVDMEQSAVQSSAKQDNPIPILSPSVRRKRKISAESQESATDEEMNESQSTLASLNQHLNTQLRQPRAKRSLRATQSLSETSSGVILLLIQSV